MSDKNSDPVNLSSDAIKLREVKALESIAWHMKKINYILLLWFFAFVFFAGAFARH